MNLKWIKIFSDFDKRYQKCNRIRMGHRIGGKPSGTNRNTVCRAESTDCAQPDRLTEKPERENQLRREYTRSRESMRFRSLRDWDNFVLAIFQLNFERIAAGR